MEHSSLSPRTQFKESEYIKALKKNYDERIQEFHLIIKDTLLRMENDEILNHLKNDMSLDQFRL